MALGGRELRLILSIQSYGTTNINRLRRDLAALSSATDIANQKALMQARAARQALRTRDLEQEVRLIRSGIPLIEQKSKAVAKIAAAEARVASIQASQIAINQQLLGIETKRATARAGIAVAEAGIQQQALNLRGLQEEEDALRRNVRVREAMIAAHHNLATASQAVLSTQARQLGLDRQLFDVQTKKINLLNQWSRAGLKQGQILEAVGMSSQQFVKQLVRMGLSQVEILKATGLSAQELEKEFAELGIRSENLSKQGALVGREWKSLEMQEKALTMTSRSLSSQLGEQVKRANQLRGEYKSLIGSNKANQRAVNENLAAQRKLTAGIQGNEAALAARRQQLAGLPEEERRLALSAESLNGQLFSQRTQLAGLQKEYKDLVKMGHRDTAMLKAKKAQLAEATAMERIYAETVREVTLAEKMQVFQRRQVFAQTAAHIGRTAQFTGLILTAVFGGASVAAANFNQNATQAATQMRDIGGDISQIAVRAKELEEAILFGRGDLPAFMTQFPAGAEDMTRSMYDLFSAINLFDKQGIAKVDEGYKLLETANKIAVAGMVDLDEATNALITVVNNFDPQMENLGETMDTVFDIIRFGRMRMSDFNTMMQKIAPAAKDAGQSLEDVGGAMVLLTERVPSQARASTMLSRSLEILQRPPIRRGLERLGIQVRKVEGGLRPLPDLMADVARTFPDIAQERTGVTELFQTLSAIGDIPDLPPDLKTLPEILEYARKNGIRLSRGLVLREEARRGWRLMLSNVEALQTRQQQIIDNRGEFEKAFEAMREAPGTQWKILINTFKAMILVVGREALPVFISLAEGAALLIRRFREMDEGTRRTIVRWVAFGSLFLLVAGTILNVSAGVYSLYNNMRLLAAGLGFTFGPIIAAVTGLKALGLRAALTSGSLMGLVAAASRLASFALIAIAIKVAIQGEAKAVDLLTGMVAGGLLGARFGGLPGAVIGAITVPIILKLSFEERDPVEQAFDRYRKSWRKGLNALEQFMVPSTRLGQKLADAIAPVKIGPPMSFEEFKRWYEDLSESAGKMSDAHDRMKGSIESVGDEIARLAQQYMAGDISVSEFADELGKLQKETSAVMSAIAKAVKDDDFAKLNKIIDNFARKADETLTAANIGKKIAEAVDRGDLQEVERLMDRYRDIVQSALEDATQAAERYAEEVDRATEEAHENMKRNIEQAVDGIARIYDRFEQINKQAMGSIFGGPTMEGIFGNIFSGINDLLRQFGVQIPVPFDILQRDMDQQLTYFKRWRQGINKLLKRGIPLELVQEIEELGPNAIPMIEGLLGADKESLRGYVQSWKQGQKMIQQAAKRDMNRQLQDYLKHGKDIALQIINGLEASQVKLREGFEQYVVKTFGDVFKAEMKKMIEEGTKEAAKDLAKAQAAIPPVVPKPPKIKPKTPVEKRAEEQAAARAAEAKIPISQLSLEQAQRQSRIAARQLRQLKEGGITAQEQEDFERVRRRRRRILHHIDQQMQAETERIRGAAGASRGLSMVSPGTTVIYEGDKTTITVADIGAGAVERAMNKQAFRKRAKGRRFGV